MPEEFDAGTRKAKNIMDSFIEALYGQSEETIPEEYDWFAPLLGDWEFDYKDKFIDGDRSSQAVITPIHNTNSKCTHPIYKVVIGILYPLRFERI